MAVILMTLSRLVSFIYLWVCIAGFIACRQRKPVVIRAYYYWQNSTTVAGEEKAFLRKHAVTKLYAKCLDIDWNSINHAYPLTITNVHHIAYGFSHYNDTLNAKVVPVVFMTNKTFLQIDSTEIPMLATHILRKCIPGFDSLSIPEHGSYHYTVPEEVQFDCDWTITTEEKYFYFLRCVKAQLGARPVTISATIRLHQFKNPHLTGIPPADRGMLMVYNISRLTEYTPVNSIYDNEKAKPYFTRKKNYDLPLDIALPAYSWAIFFHHGKFSMIDNGLTRDSLENMSFLRRAPNGFYQVTADTVLSGLYIRPGDEIKMEKIEEATLLQAAEMAGRAINTAAFSVALFDLSTPEIQNYRHETIEQVYTRFER
ncbi:hypothetical protein HB364_32500 [Pseudoflavitalea sp. X16]|uniref:hypothetical protein n=1 Tax=Paraflavitalea devenefica TaxID=2716334 RepID=UPI0014242DDC|nr:hypothetical protein [Paraflavitalea devenefica]NII29844.1 hypothetical protein [Paraflavitalea devenefica]